MDAFGHQASPRDAAPTLSLLSPSPALTDPSRNVYFFRVFAADPAHSSQDLTPFGAQVEADFKLSAAVSAARAEVDKLAAIANASGIEAAAKSAGRKVYTSGKITGNGIASTADLTLKPESKRTLVKAAFELLKRGEDIKAGKAIAVVELPLDGKVLLVSAIDVTPLLPDEVSYLGESYFSRQTTERVEQIFRIQWFSPKEVEKRTNYRSDVKKDKT
ncbi:hypothetical protein BH10PLA1_BH10PLA1_21750 [soil metagenome]